MTYTLADRGLNTTIDVRDLNTGAVADTASQARAEENGDDDESSMSVQNPQIPREEPRESQPIHS